MYTAHPIMVLTPYLHLTDRSRSLSPGTARRRQMELQMGTSKDVPLEELKYTGTSIPSKSFQRLQSQMSRPGDESPKGRP